MSMHGSAMMYVTASYSTDVISPSISSRVRSKNADFATTWSNHVGVVREAVRVRDVLGVDARDVGTPRGLLHRRDQAVDQFTRALEERRLRNDLVEPRRMTAPQPGAVGVVREAVCVRDVLGVDARDVCDYDVPRRLLHRRDQAVDQFTRALEERRLRNDLVEPRRMTAPQPGGVGVVRETEDRDVRVRVRDVVGVDARDVRDYEVGWLDPVGGLEAVLRQEPLELAPDEEVDPTEQDRRHA
jgi:hypothetical protein